MPETPLFSDPAAAEARSGGGTLFAPLLAVAEGRASAWEFATWSGFNSTISLPLAFKRVLPCSFSTSLGITPSPTSANSVPTHIITFV